jgi:hypothetical protein
MDPRTLMTVENHARKWRGMTIEQIRATLGTMPVD